MIFYQYRIYFVLLLLLIGTWFLANFFEEKENNPIKLSVHAPNYFGSGYHKKEIMDNGQLKNELLADRIIHYSDEGATHLENPVIILYHPDKPPWNIQSESAILQADKDRLQLLGQVFIHKDNIHKNKRFEIKTSNLQIKLATSYAETKQWVEITDGSNKTEGVGLEVTFVTPIRIKLLSKVKGRYEIN